MPRKKATPSTPKPQSRPRKRKRSDQTNTLTATKPKRARKATTTTKTKTNAYRPTEFWNETCWQRSQQLWKPKFVRKPPTHIIEQRDLNDAYRKLTSDSWFNVHTVLDPNQVVGDVKVALQSRIQREEEERKRKEEEATLEAQRKEAAKMQHKLDREQAEAQERQAKIDRGEDVEPINAKRRRPPRSDKPKAKQLSQDSNVSGY